MARFWMFVLAVVCATAVACGGESRGAEKTPGPTQAGPRTAEECPAGWPGPWTACPEADWVEEIAERAGYRITGETGAALVARGRGASFYIWATEMPPAAIREASAREGWQPLGKVEGVQVFGDESLWRWWAADDFVLWLQAGPDEHSRVPSLEEMESLVRASETVRRS